MRSFAWIRTAALFAVMAGILFFFAPFTRTGYDGPLRLAEELLHGRPYLPEFLPWLEMFRHDGRDYLAYPPMVSFILLPYAWLAGGALGQGGANAILIFGSAVLLYRLVRGLPGIEHLAAWAAVAYVFGTPVLFSAVTGDVWLLMHSEGNFFLLLALLLAFVWRRPFLAGLAFMIAAQSRYVVAITGLVFAALYLGDAWRARSLKPALRSGIAFGVGAMPPLLAVLAFHWWTLGDPLLSPYSAGWREWGLKGPQFSLAYLDANWPVYTTATPLLLPEFPYLRFTLYGQSPFVMSPFFLGLFVMRVRLAWVRYFLLAAVPMASFYMVYFGTGFAQFGARYATDLYPLLIPLAFSAFGRPARFWRIALAVLLAAALFMNGYGVYVTRTYGP